MDPAPNLNLLQPTHDTFDTWITRRPLWFFVMTSFSYFVDKLSPETRVLIYGFVFGDCKHVRHRALADAEDIDTQPEVERVVYYELPTPKCTGRAIHSNIFAVSKQVSAESLETFYNAKTVRLRFEDLADGREND
ncbi:hypothetical protein LTR85_002361 [Meristemomyces frigidus]|nr:hypothetical protein LTR85_002361 [Meristemomyces frigidus]